MPHWSRQSNFRETRLIQILGKFLITVTVNAKLYHVTNGPYHLSEPWRTSKTLSVVKKNSTISKKNYRLKPDQSIQFKRKCRERIQISLRQTPANGKRQFVPRDQGCLPSVRTYQTRSVVKRIPVWIRKNTARSDHSWIVCTAIWVLGQV